jgi:hypothetical protein
MLSAATLLEICNSFLTNSYLSNVVRKDTRLLTQLRPSDQMTQDMRE